MSIHEELQIFWNAYVAAYRAGDAKTCGAMFTADAELHSPYAPPARGLDAIGLVPGHVTEGLEVGNGTSVDVFERQPDGSWLIRVCSLNSTD